MRIRNKLLLNLMGLATLALSVIAADSFYNVDSNIVSDTESKIEAVAAIQKNRVESAINNYKIQVAQVAGRTSLTDDVVSYNISPNTATVTSLKTRAIDVKLSVSDYKAVFILDKNGKTIASSSTEEMQQYFDISNLMSLKEDKKVFVSTKRIVSKDLVLTGPVIANNEFEGLVVIVTAAEEMKNIMADYTGLGKTGETTIAYRDKNGDAVFLHSPRFKQSSEILAVSKNQTGVAITQALRKNETLYKDTLDYRGKKIYAVTKYIGDTDWGLVTKIDKSEIYAPIYAHAMQLGLISLALLIITLLISLKIANTISRPIEILKAGADEISKGNLSHRVEIVSKDEFAQLANAFNKMIVAVIASRAEIDQKVSEQTSEIIEKQTDMENQQKAILNILEDVEEEKNITAIEKDKINAILQSIGDAVFVVDKNLKIILVNQITANLSGRSMEEMIGKKYVDVLNFVFEESGKINNTFITEAFKTKKVQAMSNHTILINRGGDKIPVNDSAAPLLGNDGEVQGCVVVFRDVTQERKIDQAKTEFVSLASHQLRTPLSAVNWYSEMLLAGDVGKITPDQKKYLQEIYKGNQRMVDLVNALLDVSRIELGTFAVSPEPTQLVDITKSLLVELKSQIDNKGQVIEEKYNKLEKINVDPKLIRIVIQNLLSNAVKYTPEKGKISISVLDKKNDIEIQIADTGYGIPQLQQKDIFTKLFRADNVRAKDTEGTGLGLYIVKNIVEQSGGKVWFDSAENKGTTFYVTMPKLGMKKKEGTKALEDIK